MITGIKLMNAKCYRIGWPAVVGLMASVMAAHGFAGTLTLDEALRLADTHAPSLAAQDANIRAASSAAIPAGELPNPKLIAGLQNYPIGGPDRWSVNDDFMTMQMVGIRQEMPNSDKRRLRWPMRPSSAPQPSARLNVSTFACRRRWPG
jgi:cobalt-zinc-cadmium efflux system outer membrane protein